MTTHPASISLVSTIFGLTYLGLALGKIPGLRIDRAGIVCRCGRHDGLRCALDARRGQGRRLRNHRPALRHDGGGVLSPPGRLLRPGDGTDRRPVLGTAALLAVTIALSGVLSAFLVNDVVCVALTPLVLHLCQRLRRPPIPYLVGLATAPNIGSVATITGNPQNMIIGSTIAEFTILRFCSSNWPPSPSSALPSISPSSRSFTRKMLSDAGRVILHADESLRPRVHRSLLIKSVTVTLVTVGLFFAGQPIALVALVAAGVLLLGRVRPERVFRSVDWPLLVMFAGLFVVVHAFEANVVQTWGLEQCHALLESPVVLVSGLSVLLSNLVSNVPAVLLFKPLMEVMPQKELAWLALAMSSTLAGNLTVLGSVANLIVVENARRAGTELSFLEYLKVGVPLTILTTLVGVAWLALVQY